MPTWLYRLKKKNRLSTSHTIRKKRDMLIDLLLVLYLIVSLQIFYFSSLEVLFGWMAVVWISVSVSRTSFMVLFSFKYLIVL